MKVLLPLLFVLLVPWCGAEDRGIQGSFKVFDGVLLTARCSKTLSEKLGGSEHIDLRRRSNNSTFVVRALNSSNYRWGKKSQLYRSHCVARTNLINREMSLEISCLKCPLFDLTREGLFCDNTAGEGPHPHPVITSTAVSVMDCGLQAGTAKTAEPGIAPQPDNAVISFQTQSRQLVLESNDESHTTFGELLICDTTAAKGGLVLCKKGNSSLTVIVTKEQLNSQNSQNHASPHCELRNGMVQVWSGSAPIRDKPKDNPASRGYQIACIVLAVLLVVAIIFCIMLFIRSKRIAQQQLTTSVTAKKLMDLE